MPAKTTIPGVDYQLICTACQRRALREFVAGGPPEGFAMTFTYCRHNRRSLILKCFDGKPESFMVSRIGSRRTLEATWQSFREKYAGALTEGQVHHEMQAAQGRTRH